MRSIIREGDTFMYRAENSDYDTKLVSGLDP